MRAIQALYQEYLEKHQPEQKLLILTTGGKEKSGDSRADEAAHKLVENYGVPEEMVKPLGSKPSTLGNAQSVANFFKEHQEELGKIKEMEIIINDYGVLRAWLMFSAAMYQYKTGKELNVEKEDIDTIEELLGKSITDAENRKMYWQKCMDIIESYLQEMDFEIKPIIVEEIIASQNPEGKPRFKGGKRYAKAIMQNEWVKKIIVLENNGVLDFLRGTYNS